MAEWVVQVKQGKQNQGSGTVGMIWLEDELSLQQQKLSGHLHWGKGRKPEAHGWEVSL